MPDYDELSVKTLWPEVKTEPDLAIYFPDDKEGKRLPSREYFFNVIHTIEPGYIGSLLKHAQEARSHGSTEEVKKETIEVSEEWKTKLLAHPFYSSNKTSFSIIF